METVAFLLYSVALLNLALAGIVFARNPRAEVNRVFALTATAVSAWALTNAVFQATDSIGTATVSAQVSYISALLVASSLFHFSQIFPAHPDRPVRKLAGRVAWPLWIVAVGLCFTPFLPQLVIKAIELLPERRIVTDWGLYPIAAFIFATVLGAIRSLLHSMKVAHGKERMQARYVLAGMSVTATLGLICNLILPLANVYVLVWLGPASSLVFVASTVYSIVRERLFDIRIVIKRTLVYSLLLAGIAGGYSGIEFILKETLQQTSMGSGHSLITSIGGTMIVSLFVTPGRRWLEKKIDKLVFGDKRKKLPKRGISQRNVA